MRVLPGNLLGGFSYPLIFIEFVWINPVSVPKVFGTEGAHDCQWSVVSYPQPAGV